MIWFKESCALPMVVLVWAMVLDSWSKRPLVWSRVPESEVSVPPSVPFSAAKLFSDEVSDGITVPVSELRAVFNAAMPPVAVPLMAPERLVVALLPESMKRVVSS